MSKKKVNKEKFQKLEQLRQNSEREYDRVMIYLSAGGIVVALYIYDKLYQLQLVDKITVCNIKILKVLFIFQIIGFILSILTMLISHLFSAKTMNYLQHGHNDEGHKYESLVKRLNVSSLIAFIFAFLVSLVILSIGVLNG